MFEENWHFLLVSLTMSTKAKQRVSCYGSGFCRHPHCRPDRYSRLPLSLILVAIVSVSVSFPVVGGPAAAAAAVVDVPSSF